MNDQPVNENDFEEESFEELFEAHSKTMGESLNVGDQVKGEIIAIGKDTIFIDTGTKTDGNVEKEELLDENGELSYQEGDIVELYVVKATAGEIRLSKAISGFGGLRMLEEAYEKGVPVEGKIKGPCKGGFQVEIMQRRAFCPISQMDLKYIEDADGFTGKTYQFLISQLEDNGRNIVVTRKRLLERELEAEKEKFLSDVCEGDQLDGQVIRFMPYGVFVELFPGIEGMVHVSEMSWSRVDNPKDLLAVGDAISVKVLRIEKRDQSRQLKISLSIKQITEDPWLRVDENFQEGEKVKGKVTRCADFGAFVEIAPGIEGMVHVSEMSYKTRVLKPEDVVNPGDVVSVMIKEIHSDRRRISLSIKDAEGDPWLDIHEKYKAGQVLQGVLEKKEKFGYFVSLEPGITGLLPLSNIKKAVKPALIEKLSPGEPITVIIENINSAERRISLSLGDTKEEDDWRRFMPKENKAVGSLGDKLRQALEKKNDLS